MGETALLKKSDLELRSPSRTALSGVEPTFLTKPGETEQTITSHSLWILLHRQPNLQEDTSQNPSDVLESQGSSGQRCRTPLCSRGVWISAVPDPRLAGILANVAQEHPALLDSFNVIVPDLAGFGKSEKPDVSVTRNMGLRITSPI